MKNQIIKILLKIRAVLTRSLIPSAAYKLAPISSKFGFDRGVPIDRFWIELFLQENASFIKGKCLEVTDNKYTTMFGGNKVKSSDVLDINSKNEQATIIGDLRDLGNIANNTYDTIILTHVLGLIDDIKSASSECYRILKPGGRLLLTSSCLGPMLGEHVYWRLTSNSIKYLFSPFFGSENMKIKTYGNALAGQSFWVGMAQEDLTPEQLNFIDPRFPCIVTLCAAKK